METSAAGVRAQERVRIDGRRWSIIGLLCLAFMIAYFDRQNLSFALTAKDFKSFFQLSDNGRGLLNSAFFWSYALLQIPAGWVVDRYGVKIPFAIGFGLWCVLAGCTGFAQTFTQLFLVRLILGAGEAVNTPAGMRWIRLNVPESKHGFIMGLYQAAAKVGPAIGAPLTVWLMVSYGWRAMFMILGFGALIWLVPWMMLVRDDDRELEKVAVKKAAVRAIDFGELMRSPVMWGIMIGTFCYNYFNYFCLTWLPAYFADTRGLSLNSIGWFTAFSYWGFAIVATLAGLWADRIIRQGRNAILTRKVFIIVGFLIAATEMLGVSAHSTGMALFFAVFSLSGLGLATGNYWALSPAILPGAPTGRLAAVQNFASSLPGIAAPLLTGWLKQVTGGYGAALAANAFFLVLGIGSYLFLVRPKYAPGTKMQ